MRIGVFGGSFDPPHAAHAALARTARSHLALDLLLWVPTFTPPHKNRPSAPFEARVAMTEALVSEESDASAMLVTALEASLPTPSFMLQTLKALRAGYGTEHAWHLIVGADNWAAFPRWHNPAAVLASATLVVYPRPGFPVGDLPPGVVLLNFPEMPEQSTDFRSWLVRDRPAALAALPAPVAAYIRERNLYAMVGATSTGEPS